MKSICVFNKNQWLRGALILSLATALFQFSQAGYLYTKAVLAQQLIASSWQQTLRSQQTVKPWRWADTWPVARLQMNTHTISEDLYVLAGASGSSLAFGPGHMEGTALPGSTGNSVIGGHRDTHFAFLEYAAIGDKIRLQNKNGLWRDYQISAMNIRDIDAGPLLIDPSETKIQLVTCYPFNALTSGGPLRYVVTAVRV